MKDLISDIVKAIVDQPDRVSVAEVEGGHTVVLELRGHSKIIPHFHAIKV